jgi:hypothetical protein
VDPEQKWIRPVDAARELGVSATRIQQLVDKGVLEGQRTILGRLVGARSVAEEAARRRAGTGADGR